MSRRILRLFSLGLALGPLIGCSLTERRPPVREERHPPAVATGKGALKEKGPAPREIEQVKREEKAPPREKDDGPSLGPAPQPEGAKSGPKAPEKKDAPAKNGKPGPGEPPGAKPPGGVRNPLDGPPGPPPGPLTRPAPTAYGSVLQLPPGESPIERAIELTRRIEALHVEKKALQLRLSALEEAIQARDKQLTAATGQVREATDEVAQARRDLQAWADDLRERQARLKQQEKENQELLQVILGTLEKIVQPDPAPPAGVVPGAP